MKPKLKTSLSKQAKLSEPFHAMTLRIPKSIRAKLEKIRMQTGYSFNQIVLEALSQVL